MDFLKKWTSCIFSFIAGVLALAMSACTGMVVTGSINLTAIGLGTKSVDKVTKAFKVLTDSSLYTDEKNAGIGKEFITMKVFAIVTLVIAVLFIIYSIVMLLKNLNVIKSDIKALNIAGWSLVGLFLIATIGLLISSNTYANLAIELTKVELISLGVPTAIIPTLPIEVVGKVGLYQPFMLATSIVLALTTAVFAFINRKKA